MGRDSQGSNRSGGKTGTTGLSPASELVAAGDLAGGESLETPEWDVIRFEEVSAQWLRLDWLLSEKVLARSESSLGRESYGAQRVLRLFDLDPGETGLPTKTKVSQIELPNGCNEWFLRLPSRERTWEVEIGVISAKGRYFTLINSSPISLKSIRLPQVNLLPEIRQSSLFDALESDAAPPLQVEHSFVMQGETSRRAQVFVDDQAVPVDSQTGRFEWRLPLANGRIVVPLNVVDSGHVTRALLAVEMNFHRLESESTDEF